MEEFNKRLMSFLNATLYFETNKTLDDLENDLNYFIEMLKENSLKGIIKKINNSLYTCDYDYIEEITGFKKLKYIFYSIKDFKSSALPFRHNSLRNRRDSNPYIQSTD